VEPLSAARTPLADFLNSLLEGPLLRHTFISVWDHPAATLDVIVSFSVSWAAE